MTITLSWLKKQKACEDQVKLFQELFGKSVKLTEELVLEHGSKFDLHWLASKAFSAPLLADYEAKIAPLLADYEAKCAPLLADYWAKVTPLLEDSRVRCTPLLADSRAKCAPLFWQCVQKMEEA